MRVEMSDEQWLEYLKEHPDMSITLSDDQPSDNDTDVVAVMCVTGHEGAEDKMALFINEDFSNQAQALVNRGYNKYTWGFEYAIVPLRTNLSQKGNDREQKYKYDREYANQFHIGDIVSGRSLRDHEDHTGRIVSFTWLDDSGLKYKYVWVLDLDNMRRYPLIPNGLKKIDNHTTMKNSQQQNPYIRNIRGHYDFSK